MLHLIDSVDKFKEACANKYEDFIIKLDGGVFSRKECSYDKDTNEFFILNCIDSTTQYLTSSDLFNKQKTNIGHAIIVGKFFHKTYD